VRVATTFGILLTGIAILTLHAILELPWGRWIGLLGLACFAIGAVQGRSLYRGANLQSSTALAAARRLAAGDLTGSGDEAGAADDGLCAALGQVNERIFKIIAAVRAGTASIASTSGLTTSDSSALSARTDAQAASLEETASAMEQLAATVRQNADHARQGSARMAATHASALHGSQVVQDVVHNMAVIKERSAQVADIVSVIDGIAFQTNILALNAAVEAARAGDEGRGFAVVAGEVRALAHRCAAAARDIKGLIAGSVEQVDAGNALVADAGRAMNEIVANVGEVAGIMNDIASATAEQSAGIEEINKSVVHIDGMTQQNAALVQELARTAEMLREEAEQLAGVASGFRLGAREFGSAQEAVAMVRHAVEFTREAGAAALVEEVRKLGKGRFIDRDLYLSVYHLGGRVAAHGASRRFWDIPWAGFKDADGRLFLADMVAAAQAGETGWIDYKWVHPMSKESLLKSAYFERCGDLVVACGVYKQKAPVSAPGRGLEPPARRIELRAT
jgi:methyl-accepting chemotaxis protein